MNKPLLTPARFIGFESLLAEINSLQSTNSFPPHNILTSGERTIVELAVAGFKRSDIKVHLRSNILTVTGENTEHTEFTYQYKGISTKSFSKSFRLSEFTKVLGAEIIDGILSITLMVEVPEEKDAEEIAIN